MNTVITVPNIPTITTSSTYNSILTNTGWTTSSPAVDIGTHGITLCNGGDIYQMSNKNPSDGVFNRLERLERMMGILRRDNSLEEIYQPLKEAGDKYDKVLDTAIADIMNIAIHTMKQHADDYDRLSIEATVYRALTKEETK